MIEINKVLLSFSYTKHLIFVIIIIIVITIFLMYFCEIYIHYVIIKNDKSWNKTLKKYSIFMFP